MTSTPAESTGRPGSVVELNATIDDILKGSFDLHVHAGPDPTRERRLDALDVARYAHEAEMGGFVLKSHEYPTAPLAHVLNRMYPGLNAIGSLTLNEPVGGLNHHAVEVAGRLGARVVWMPTHSAEFGSRGRDKGSGISLVTELGTLNEKAHLVLDAAARWDMVVASGHVSPTEALVLFKAASDRGMKRLVATHPAGIATIEEQREMVSLGAYMEYTFLSCMPSGSQTAPEELVARLRAIGVANCLVTTDFGQRANPPPAEGMRMAIATLLEAGMSPQEVETLVKDNPRLVIGATG